MNKKAPLIAIAISLIIAIVIYLFADIRPPKNQAKEIQDTEIEYDALAFIEKFNETLSEESKSYIEKLLEIVNQEDLSNVPVDVVDEIIAFYEKNEQYNFSAWFHTAKAKILNTHDSWSIAGTRQYSVSQNDAYEADFNEILRAEALKSYRKAIELDSTVLDTRVKLASCYLDNSQQTMEGITMLLAVIEEDSMHINANLLLGRFGIVSTQYDKAIKRLENVLSLQPENTEALFLLAEAYGGMGEMEKAIETLIKCRDLIENEALKKEIDLYIKELKP